MNFFTNPKFIENVLAIQAKHNAVIWELSLEDNFLYPDSGHLSPLPINLKEFVEQTPEQAVAMADLWLAMVHERQAFPDNPYFTNGGGVSRPGPSHYNLWQQYMEAIDV